MSVDEGNLLVMGWGDQADIFNLIQNNQNTGVHLKVLVLIDEEQKRATTTTVIVLVIVID